MQFKLSICIMSLIGCMFLPSSAIAAQDGDYTYTVSGGNATIKAYTGAGGVLSIPAALGGYPTVGIEDNAFFNNTGITNVSFPGSLVSIGKYAFAECTGLTSVGIISAGVTSIGEAVFSSCTGLTSITVDAGNPAYSSQNGVLYNKNKTVLIQYPAGKTGVVTIPGSVTSIGAEAFRCNSHITSLTIPDSITNIGYRGFARLYSLTSVTIPASVTSIGTYGFFGGISNTGITVQPDNPNYSSLDGVLYNKDKTALIQYPCGKAGAFIVPASVTSVGIAAFEMCTVVTSITFTGNVESIAEAAFESNTGLTSITIPGSLTSIVRWAFWGGTNLTRAYFYGNAPVMGEAVFDKCGSGFTVYYLAGSTGFTNPWHGYPTAVFDGTIITTTTPPGTTTTTTSDDPGTTTTTTSSTNRTLCPAQKVLGEDNPDLENLRVFRDGPLAQSAVGRRLIQIYYNNADSINDALDRSPALRAVARKFFEAVAAQMENKK